MGIGTDSTLESELLLSVLNPKPPKPHTPACMPACPGGPLSVCKQTQREIDALGMTMVVVVVMVEPYLRPIHSCNAHRELETESRRRRRRRKRGEREREREI
jgi:hypothetical protein